MRSTQLLLIVVVGSLAGCSPLSPAPFATRNAAALPAPEGATTFTAVIGITTSAEFGSELRVHHQVREDLSIGGAVGGGWSAPKRDGAMTEPWLEWLFAGRFIGNYFPNEEALAIPFGLGLGVTNTGLVYSTVNTGVAVSSTGETKVYAEPFVALSVPIRKGRPMRKYRPPGRLMSTLPEHQTPARSWEEVTGTTYWLGLNLGVLAPYQESWASSLEASVVVGGGPGEGLPETKALLTLGQSHTSVGD